ncbi:MAG: 5-formyltetrahydrofolate cyclo-ligase [Spirochaetales bacterium]|nr:5-formyltetrahydrofolate cyclo-ligase [Spirochaetales bacterium]
MIRFQGRKEALRKDVKTQLSTLEEKERGDAPLHAASLLMQTPQWKECAHLLTYLAFREELDTHPLIEAAFHAGKTVYAPVIQKSSMEFLCLESPSGPFVEGKWGLREPHPSAEIWTPNSELTVMIVPGMAFDEKGQRLGRGGGYYDRFLRRFQNLNQTLWRVGYAFEAQVVEKVPTLPHDQPIDALITNKKTRQFSCL